MGGLTGILVADQAGPERVTRLVLVDVVPRFEKNGSARIRDFMFSGLHGFATLDEAADAVAAYLPHRTKPRSPEGLKKNLRLRDGRWYWHWDPAFMTKPGDDPFARMDKIEQRRDRLTIPILLIRGKLSDVVSPEGVNDFLAKVPARRVRRTLRGGPHRRRRRQRRVQRGRRRIRRPVGASLRSPACVAACACRRQPASPACVQ